MKMFRSVVLGPASLCLLGSQDSLFHPRALCDPVPSSPSLFRPRRFCLSLVTSCWGLSLLGGPWSQPITPEGPFPPAVFRYIFLTPCQPLSRTLTDTPGVLEHLTTHPIVTHLASFRNATFSSQHWSPLDLTRCPGGCWLLVSTLGWELPKGRALPGPLPETQSRKQCLSHTCSIKI